MKILKNTGGFTLIEVLTVATIMGVIGTGALAMMISSVASFNDVNTQTYTDTDAVIAMQKIIRDVREAKYINMINASGNIIIPVNPGDSIEADRLRVVNPKKDNTYGCYDRHFADTANSMDYYLSDSTGLFNHTGDILWKKVNGANPELLKRGVFSIHFNQDTDYSRMVEITIITQNDASKSVSRGGKVRQTKLIQRVVYMRNW